MTSARVSGSRLSQTWSPGSVIGQPHIRYTSAAASGVLSLLVVSAGGAEAGISAGGSGGPGLTWLMMHSELGMLSLGVTAST
jgi:hypothetical protein